MKKSKIIFGILASLSLFVTHVQAVEQDDYSQMSSKISEFVNVYRDLGMTSGQLANILNKTYKSDQQSFDQVLPYSFDDIVSGNQTRESIEGNPPADDQEANERYAYIRDVLAREYSADKYKDKQDAYFGYLYASHYIENTAYDRNNPNFDNIMAEIIGPEDINVFNKFYSYSAGATTLQCFKALNDSYLNFNSLSTAGKTMIRDTVVTAIDSTNSNVSLILDEMNKSGIVDKGTQVDTMNFLYQTYMAQVDTATSSEQMIELMYNNLGGKDISLDLVSTYAKSMFGIATLTTVASFTLPVIAGVCYFTDVLSKAFSLGALGALYYSGQARKADRLAIKYGLIPKP